MKGKVNLKLRFICNKSNKHLSKLSQMQFSSIDDLNRLEYKIQLALKGLKLGDALHSLYISKNNSTEIVPFTIAGFALLATRFCLPSKASQTLKSYNIQNLINLSNSYFLADPITFDKELEEEFYNQNPIFMMLRSISSQFPFEPPLFGDFSRPFYLYHEIPKQLIGVEGIPDFDFESKFQKITGVSTVDFITLGFILHAVSDTSFTFSREYFQKLRKQNINVPDDRTVRFVLAELSGDKSKLIKLYEERKNSDRRFKAYDFNPFLQYPLIKPCQNKQFSKSKEEYYHAPVPNLIASRISTGIFYQMFNEYKIEFSNYFGFVFEKYVGLVLENCVVSETILSESDIRKFYPTNKGKVPDWVVLDGSTAILIECKATRFSRAAQSIASEKVVNLSLKQVTKGLKQLTEFISACRSKVTQLNKFHHCDKFISIVMSLEPMYLINSDLFQNHIDSLLEQKNIPKFDWQILSINELESIQPHLINGIKLSQVMENLRQGSFNDVLDNLVAQTNPRRAKAAFEHARRDPGL
ncbi:MAG: hypothetical protein AAGF83_17115 [Cyanobacteria bacterium P01_G01_bin.67]